MKPTIKNIKYILETSAENLAKHFNTIDRRSCGNIRYMYNKDSEDKKQGIGVWYCTDMAIDAIKSFKDGERHGPNYEWYADRPNIQNFYSMDYYFKGEIVSEEELKEKEKDWKNYINNTKRKRLEKLYK